MFDLEEKFKALEGNAFSRRSFMKVLSAAGLLSLVNVEKISAASSSAKGKVVIVGGGAAGLSIAARLMRILDEPDVTLIDPSDRQYFQPGFTMIAGGIFQPDEVWKKQTSCIPDGVKWIKDKVVAIDPDRNVIKTSKKGIQKYDYLVLVPGIQMNWEKVEGLSLDRLGQGNAHSAYDFEGSQKVWKAMQEFSRTGGKGVFVDTYTKIKCGGVPKKITLLTENYTRDQGTRSKVDLNYFTAASKLYSKPYYTPRLEQIYKERNIPITLNTKVKGVDLETKKIYFEKTEKVADKEVVTPFTEDYDFLHFAPPMSAPDFVREAGLGWQEGSFARESWVMVDPVSLVHKKYKNIVSYGDVAGLPTSKTSAAVRKQTPIATANLISLMEGKEPTAKYDGYACCPIVTGYGEVLLCEFVYGGKAVHSFPFSLQDMSKEQYSAWLLKKYVIKPLYFDGMITGLV